MLYKTDLPFRFCKIGLRNTLFIFGRKMVVCCNTLSEKDAIELTSRWRFVQIFLKNEVKKCFIR